MVYFLKFVFTISYPLFIDVYGQPESCIIAVFKSKNDTMWQQKELKYFFLLLLFLISNFLTKI